MSEDIILKKVEEKMDLVISEAIKPDLKGNILGSVKYAKGIKFQD